jgi:putative DNA primase/helicase
MAKGGFGPSKPTPLVVDAAKIPRYLQALHNWVLWRYQLKRQKDGSLKWTKLPFRPNGRCASHADVRTWSTFATVIEGYEEGTFDGIGLVTAGTGIAPRRRDKLVLIDLDKVRDVESGEIEPWAAEILEAAVKERAYIELSPSATGFHIIGEGPQGFAGRKANGLELYCSSRFFTISGGLAFKPRQRVPGKLDETIELASARLGVPKPTDRAVPKHGAPTVVGVRPYADSWTDEDILELAFTKHNGKKLRRLLEGDISDYDGDASDADMGAATMLAFWFWLDAAAIERVMRESKLARDKWDTKRGKLTYLQYTIRNALDGKEDYYGKVGRVVTNNSNVWARV